jgi:YihY family inner membrane protein
MFITDKTSKLINLTAELIRKFISDRCMTHASALAFSSMFSLVPFLAIVFAVLKELDLHNTMTPVILSHVSAGSHEIVVSIMNYINNTNFGTLGVAGLVMLFMSIMFTLDTVEDAFNQIWGLDRGKAYHHKLRDYMIVIVGIPLMIALAVSMTTALENQYLVKWLLTLPFVGHLLMTVFKFVSYFSVWIAMFCLYKFIPNVKIRIRNAVIGALVAGTLWQFVQWAFIHFQVGVLRRNTIYGALSILPAFMIWILAGWVIVLLGMQLIYFMQKDGKTNQVGDD